KLAVTEETLWSLAATVEGRTTDALILARDALRAQAELEKGDELGTGDDPRPEVAAYTALEHHHAAARYEFSARSMDAATKGPFAVVTSDHEVSVVNPANGLPIHRQSGLDGKIYNIAMQPGGKILAVGYEDGRVEVWDSRHDKQPVAKY